MKRVLLLLPLVVVLAGCRHKAPPLVAINTPAPPPQVALDQAPAPVAVQQVPSIPQAAAPLPAKTVPARPPKKARRKVTAPPVQAPLPVQVASAGPPVPAASVVGALSSGGDDNSEMQKKASDLLANLKTRLAALQSPVVEQQREQIVRIKYFWSQADAALKAGDADGAWNLATKAKVLLDDFSK